MCIVLSNKPYMLNGSFTYSAWTLFILPFSNFLDKNFERRHIFRFFRYQVPYLRSSLRDGFSPVFCSSLIWRIQTLKFLRLYLLFFIMKALCIIGGDKPFKILYISLARFSKLFWCIVFYLVISGMSWKELTWSL